jgi:hypothetical protein
MFSAQHCKLFVAGWVAAGLLFCVAPRLSAQAPDPRVGHEPTNMVVVVKEADTGAPVSQARITLQFTIPHGPTMPMKGGKKLTYNAKTDSEGRCKLSGINKGSITLVVTAPNHQTYGKELQLEKDDQVIEVKLKKPQPLI